MAGIKVTNPILGEGPVTEGMTVEVDLSPTDLAGLSTTPMSVVAAPGEGKVVVVDDVVAFLDFETTQYGQPAGNNDLEFRYTDASGALILTAELLGFIDAAADAYRSFRPVSHTVVPNAPVVITSGAHTAGDSPLKLVIHHRIVRLAE